MFILHSSNKTENLLTHLTTVVESIPLSNPLAKEVFLIQSSGMERWLSQQLASYFGVWGNYQFLFPGKFFSSLSKKIDQKLSDDIFDRNLMLWHFEKLLRNLQDDCFSHLNQYMQGENEHLKRFQLAHKLAHVFDQYQMMRPDMLDLWQQGKLLYNSENEVWQRELWQQITPLIGDKHRGSLWLDVINLLNNAEEGTFSYQLPERLFVFGLNTMPPLFLNYLQGLSRHCDVHLFLLNPAQVYWADLVNKKQFDHTEDDAHPLLSALGQQGREFQQLLLEQTKFTYEPESFEEVPPNNNLQQLQNDILNNRLQETKLDKDDSISLHACHSRAREIEVLRDQILNTLAKDSALTLRDIVVMAPNIQTYVPFISATFHDLQHAIADKSMRLDNSALSAFTWFLKISQERFGWQDIIQLLEQPVIYKTFSLLESDLDLINHWVEDTRVRWGKSASHKESLKLPPLDQNTWQAMLDRLLMGYAVGSEEHFIDDTLPYQNIEGSSTQVLGGLNDFLQLLFKASDELAKPASLEEWGQRFYYYADQLLSNHTPTEKLERQQINEVFEELSHKFSPYHSEMLSLNVMTSWLSGKVSESRSSNGFLRGQLTFCSMLPMRSIPFKVIALLGINEGEFPKIDCNPTFDLVGQHFRVGDRSRRSDDRYQFLEVLLSARQQLIISYCGLSIQNNDDIPPSVIISELLDVLENYYQLTDLITKHPLQPFSYRYFDGQSESLYSYSETHFKTAVALQEKKTEKAVWWQGSIENEQTNIIEINDLFSFYRQPQRYFLRKQLGIYFQEMGSIAEEREPFKLDTLENYNINQQWVDSLLQDKPFDLQKLQAQGQWLSGVQGQLLFDQQEAEISQFTDVVTQNNLGESIDNQAIDITINGYRLIGQLGNLYQKGSVLYRYASLKGKDFMLAWLHHLIINHINPQETCLISKEGVKRFAVDPKNITTFSRLIDIYHQGQQQPNVFFTEASLTYVEQALKIKTSTRKGLKPAIEKAKEQLKKDIDMDLSVKQLYQSVENLSDLLNPNFEQQCTELIMPVWEATFVKD